MSPCSHLQKRAAATPFCLVYSVPKTAVTQCDRHFRKQRFTLLWFGTESLNSGSSFLGSRRRLCPNLPAHLGWVPAIPAFSCVAWPCMCLCPSLLLLKGHSQAGLGAALLQSEHTHKTPFPQKAAFTGSAGEHHNTSSWETQLSPSERAMKMK